MNADEILTGTGLISDELRAEFHPVDLRSVRVVAAPAPMRWMWPKDVGAMAIRRKIYMSPALLKEDPNRIKYLTIHELVHTRQWADYGFFGFLRRYIAEYLRGRRHGLGHQQAYRQNRLEVEAREVESRYRSATR